MSDKEIYDYFREENKKYIINLIHEEVGNIFNNNSKGMAEDAVTCVAHKRLENLSVEKFEGILERIIYKYMRERVSEITLHSIIAKCAVRLINKVGD